MSKIKDAIIIHGPGRSGTTLVSNIFSLHPDLSWISAYNDFNPKWPMLATANRLMKWPVLEKFSRGRRKFPRPTEPYGFWQYFFPNFNDRSGAPVEINKKVVEECAHRIDQITRYGGGERFITKLTGISRINYLDELFENPYVIWVERQPQSVLMSFYKQRWFYKNKSEEFARKSTQELLDQYFSFYQQIYDGKEELQKFRFLEVKYEDFIEDPQASINRMIEFTNLRPSKKYMKTVQSWEIQKGTNDAYKRNLNTTDLAYLDSLLDPYCQKLGYTQHVG